MNSRQEQLLNLVIESYIKTAEPVGSNLLAEKGVLGVSGATLRNEMRALEEEGYLSHPHTSAGRVPTEKGYKFYLENVDYKDCKLSKKDDLEIEKLSNSVIQCGEQGQKDLVKSLAELSGETMLLAFSPDRVYYTGLSNLFSKPEFAELQLVADVSQIFDHCEECLKTFFDEVENEPKYFIGREHSFGNALSVLAFRFGEQSLLALLGPMRMNYRRNHALMWRARLILSSRA
ncbi:MAG: hypothetical protein AAB963_01575 [Patescibacteria group bacterium]